MKSLLGNLLGNAWKYTTRTPNAQVELTCTQATGGVVFSVRDNGAGFDMSRSQRLFEPFQRLHTAAEFPGVGIGLAIVARIVRRYSRQDHRRQRALPRHHLPLHPARRRRSLG